MTDRTTNPYQSPAAAESGELLIPNLPAELKTRRALLISFGVISVLGGTFVFLYWMSISLVSAVTRIAAFAVIMAGVHWIGYRLWQRQSCNANPTSTPGTARTAAARPRWFGKWVSAVLILIGTGFLLLLDGQLFTNSVVFLGCWAVSLVFWLLRRRETRGTGTVFVILLHMILIAWVLLGLPESYRWQKRLNERRAEWRQRAHQIP